MKNIFAIKGFIIHTRTGVQYEIENKRTKKFQATVLSHFEELSYDEEKDKQKLFRINKCKKIGILVNLDEIYDASKKERLMKFFEGSFGMRNVDCVSVLFEDGSKIDYFVPKNFRKHQSFQDVYIKNNETFGVCFLGFDNGKDKFLKECGLIETKEEK